MKTEEDDEFERIERESGWRKRQIEQSEMCSNYGGFCKKEWVGLTDDEIYEIYEATERLVGEHWDGGGTILMFPTTLYQAFETKLKEKNT
jgi:hypothetical protein